MGSFVVVVNDGDSVNDKQRLTLLRVKPLYCGVHALSRLVLGKERALGLVAGR